MKITASEDCILIEGCGKHNRTVKLMYSTKQQGWMVVQEDQTITGEVMSLDEVLTWAKVFQSLKFV